MYAVAACAQDRERLLRSLEYKPGGILVELAVLPRGSPSLLELADGGDVKWTGAWVVQRTSGSVHEILKSFTISFAQVWGREQYSPDYLGVLEWDFALWDT